MKANFAHCTRLQPLSRTTATLALCTAMVLWSGIAHAATRRAVRPTETESKTIREAKTVQVQRPAPERRRLLSFYERFYPGAVRSFTTWW
jgi:hypothetical protein